MSSVAMTHMHAAKGVNSALTNPGLTSGGVASPVDVANFLDALEQAISANQNANATNLLLQLPKGQNNGQNLPSLNNSAQNPANITDPMQLLMAQLMAQGLANQQSAQVQQTAQLGQISAQTNPISAFASAQSLQSLMLSNSLGVNAVNPSGSQAAQQFDPNQASMMSIALAKALRASGKDLNADTQNQAASLLASLQQASLSNQFSNQDSGQSLGQIASAIQSLAQKNGITLPADLQQRLSDLASQSNAGAIKLLGIQAGTAVTDNTKLNALDLARSYSAQNLADAKSPKTLSAAIDKLQKGKTLDNAFAANSALSASTKNHFDKVASATNPQFSELKDANEGSNALQDNSNLASDLKSAKELTEGSDLAASSVFTNGIARADSHIVANQHTATMKASEVSLVSGPLHTEVMNAAKSGGGRIMLELTPPEQGTIRIDLRIGQNGQAHLIVEGASDATKSRLDQGGQNLKNEFAQMGLNLSLDLRQGAQSQMAREQGFSNGRQTFYASSASSSPAVDTSSALLNPVSGDNRENSGTVHLYA